MATGNEELNQFKTQINLCEYAIDQGFVLDPKQSSRSSAVLRHPSGSKIVVSRKPNKHWVFFDVHSSESGTVIDFAKFQKPSLSFGQIRKELRPWISGTSFSRTYRSSAQPAPDLLPTRKDFQQVRRRWEQGRCINEASGYLTARAISPVIIEHAVFADTIRVDDRQNCLFGHWNEDRELCGFEIKNKGFTGFSPGGEKRLWQSRTQGNVETLCVFESVIDALSFATLFGIEGKQFVSTAGKCSPQQIDQLVKMIVSATSVAELWLALDHDESGKAMAAEIRIAVAATRSANLKIVDRFPKEANSDWNDVLRWQTESPQSQNFAQSQ